MISISVALLNKINEIVEKFVKQNLNKHAKCQNDKYSLFVYNKKTDNSFKKCFLKIENITVELFNVHLKVTEN